MSVRNDWLPTLYVSVCSSRSAVSPAETVVEIWRAVAVWLTGVHGVAAAPTEEGPYEVPPNAMNVPHDPNSPPNSSNSWSLRCWTWHARSVLTMIRVSG